eukprot:3487754-Rhodomonas_salina.2
MPNVAAHQSMMNTSSPPRQTLTKRTADLEEEVAEELDVIGKDEVVSVSEGALPPLGGNHFVRHSSDAVVYQTALTSCLALSARVGRPSEAKGAL